MPGWIAITGIVKCGRALSDGSSSANAKLSEARQRVTPAPCSLLVQFDHAAQAPRLALYREYPTTAPRFHVPLACGLRNPPPRQQRPAGESRRQRHRPIRRLLAQIPRFARGQNLEWLSTMSSWPQNTQKIALPQHGKSKCIKSREVSAVVGDEMSGGEDSGAGPLQVDGWEILLEASGLPDGVW